MQWNTSTALYGKVGTSVEQRNRYYVLGKGGGSPRNGVGEEMNRVTAL